MGRVHVAAGAKRLLNPSIPVEDIARAWARWQHAEMSPDAS
jgi:hypothetical protein